MIDTIRVFLLLCLSSIKYPFATMVMLNEDEGIFLHFSKIKGLNISFNEQIMTITQENTRFHLVPVIFLTLLCIIYSMKIKQIGII
jgi:hypothetical protein